MSRIEDRLREAYGEAVGTVRPDSIGGLDLESGLQGPEKHRVGHPRKRSQALVAIAAASSVACVVVAAAVVIPSLGGGVHFLHSPRLRLHQHGAQHIKPPATAALAALPKYTVLNNSNKLEVVVTSTGRVAGRLRAPAGQVFAVIAGTADDRTFFVSTQLSQQTSCQAYFYRFSLGASGQPSALTTLPVGPLPGLPTALAASADGNWLAFSVTKCAGQASGQSGLNQLSGGIDLFNVVGGKIARHWSYTLGEDYTTDLSMSADGSLLGYSNYQDAKYLVGRVLPATSASGPDQAHSLIVVHSPNTTALSGSAMLMYALTGTHRQTLAAYATRNGQQVRVLYRWPASAEPGTLVMDPAGGYVLVLVSRTPGQRRLTPYVKGDHCLPVTVNGTLMCDQAKPTKTHFESVNLATGAVTTLPMSEPGMVGWGTVAW